jgi:CrcB protein
MTGPTWLAFLAAAAIGAPARYLLDEAVERATGRSFPWGACVVNVSGSFILGVVTGLALYHGFSSDVGIVLGTGFCGAYTTFSAFSFATVRLGERGEIRGAAANVVANVTGSLLAAGAGLALSAAL